MEPFFLLGYYFGMSWKEYYHFPVAYRHWLLKRINQELEKASKNDPSVPPGSKGAHDNTSDIRSMLGKQRETVPAKLRRF